MLPMMRRLVRCNIELSSLFDRLLPAEYAIDGNAQFKAEVLPPLIGKEIKIYDLGSGSRPYITAEQKRTKNLTVIGLDISSAELAAAPDGSYDETIVADVTKYIGRGDADLVICQATLEHVTDTEGAIRAIASSLKAGGHAAIFAPSRNALFARINLLLPETLKRKILFTLFPEKATGHEGFRAYYNRCTPREIQGMAEKYELELREQHLFWKSSYFSFFLPLYVLWRFWLLAARAIMRDEAAETFAFVFRKKA